MSAVSTQVTGHGASKRERRGVNLDSRFALHSNHLPKEAAKHRLSWQCYAKLCSCDPLITQVKLSTRSRHLRRKGREMLTSRKDRVRLSSIYI
jgi:hypothetical protein